MNNNPPRYAKFTAFDSDGSQWYYERKPKHDDARWFDGGVCGRLNANEAKPKYWKSSLRRVKR